MDFNKENDELKIDENTLKRYFVRARLQKTCTCKNKQIKIDILNRELECSICGAKLDPFDVVVELYRQEDRYWNILNELREECEKLEKWQMNNRMGAALRRIASEIRSGRIPACPHCGEPFDLENINTWWRKEYAEAHYQQKMMKARENNDRN